GRRSYYYMGVMRVKGVAGRGLRQEVAGRLDSGRRVERGRNQGIRWGRGGRTRGSDGDEGVRRRRALFRLPIRVLRRPNPIGPGPAIRSLPAPTRPAPTREAARAAPGPIGSGAQGKSMSRERRCPITTSRGKSVSEGKK